jgi:hypothetical protein
MLYNDIHGIFGPLHRIARADFLPQSDPALSTPLVVITYIAKTQNDDETDVYFIIVIFNSTV